ncbi:MAG: glycosyltransferase [Paludibacteraceae bacterium]|nr:glycosyltransferase [Paludibacteraceae bacterium]
MKVLSVNTNDTHGGAARAAMRIMQGVQQHGVETQMLVKEQHSRDTAVVSLHQFLPKNKLYCIADWVAQKLKNKYYHRLWRPYIKTKENVFMSDSRGTRMGGALQRLDYDVLHLHWINQRFIKLQDLPENKPIVWTLHDSWPFCGVCHYFLDCERYQTHCVDCPMLHSGKEKDLAYRIFEEKLRAYRNLNLHIVTPSRWLGECAKQSALLGQFPVTVIPNCLDTDVYRPLTENEKNKHLELAIQRNQALRKVKRAVGEKAAKPLILYGAMNAATDRIKGFASFLSALRMLDKQGFEANLVVFGASESDLPMQFEHIRVHFLGYISDTDTLVTLYNLADVMVVSSLTEVFGQTASEALACSTPVVCFQTTGIQEVVDHKINGYQAAFKDSSDLAQGIRWCLDNNHDGSLSKAAREKVIREYTIDRVGEMYAELYETIRRKVRG